MPIVLNPFVTFLKEQWAPLALAILIVAVIAFAFLAFFLSREREKKNQLSLKEASNTVRVLMVDFKEQEVTYFDLSSIRQVKKVPLTDFYSGYNAENQAALADWFLDLSSKKKDVPDYLELKVRAKKGDFTKHSLEYFSMLEVVGRGNQKVYLESYLFKSIRPQSPKRGKKQNRHVTSEELAKAYASSNKGKGLTLYVRYFYRDPAKVDRKIPPLVYDKLEDAIFKSTGDKYRLLVSEEEGKGLLVSDPKISRRNKGHFLVALIQDAVKRELVIQGVSSEISCCVGAVEHQLYQGEGPGLLLEAKKCAEEAYQTDAGCVWYDRDRTEVVRDKNGDEAYRDEVARIVEEKKLSVSYRPMMYVPDLSIYGYLCQCVPRDAFFGSIDDLKDYAMRTGSLRELLAAIAKKSIPNFLSSNPNDKSVLFFPVKMDELPFLLSTFASLSMPLQNTHRIEFLIAQRDIMDALASSQTNVQGIIDRVEKIKAKNYQVALLVNGSELSLADAIYPVFDSYIVSFAFAGADTGIDTKIRSGLHALVERLIKYEKPIMVSDVEGWPAVELMVRSGLDYISANCIAPYDEMLTPISPKSLRKLEAVKGH